MRPPLHSAPCPDAACPRSGRPLARRARPGALAAGALLLLALLGGCAAVALGESREETLAEARTYLRSGQWEAAERVLRPLVERAPGDGEARVLLGRALVGQGRWLEGFTELRQGLTRLEPEQRERVLAELLDALLRAGRGLLEERRFPESVEAFREALRLSEPAGEGERARRELLDALTAWGQSLLEQSDPEGAVRRFSEALRLDPGRIEAWLGLVRSLLREGRIREAIDAIRRALERSPDDPELRDALRRLTPA